MIVEQQGHPFRRKAINQIKETNDIFKLNLHKLENKLAQTEPMWNKTRRN